MAHAEDTSLHTAIPPVATIVKNLRFVPQYLHQKKTKKKKTKQNKTKKKKNLRAREQGCGPDVWMSHI
jgi:hypothetical protein